MIIIWNNIWINFRLFKHTASASEFTVPVEEERWKTTHLVQIVQKEKVVISSYCNNIRLQILQSRTPECLSQGSHQSHWTSNLYKSSEVTTTKYLLGIRTKIRIYYCEQLWWRYERDQFCRPVSFNVQSTFKGVHDGRFAIVFPAPSKSGNKQ